MFRSWSNTFPMLETANERWTSTSRSWCLEAVTRSQFTTPVRTRFSPLPSSSISSSSERWVRESSSNSSLTRCVYSRPAQIIEHWLRTRKFKNESLIWLISSWLCSLDLIELICHVERKTKTISNAFFGVRLNFEKFLQCDVDCSFLITSLRIVKSIFHFSGLGTIPSSFDTFVLPQQGPHSAARNSSGQCPVQTTTMHWECIQSLRGLAACQQHDARVQDQKLSCKVCWSSSQDWRNFGQFRENNCFQNCCYWWSCGKVCQWVFQRTCSYGY